ncbi:uncharacterized protein LOC121382278 [Gigantopelta aegis]|uniref:uncharacterized protein LOC121382278 n=1 Tax=Gigantopelta aegis TaxID=1735272 RepID=UPI001B88DDC2|nr:uncharacterized protein LOC121382278 [Gigantopelta aegis]
MSASTIPDIVKKNVRAVLLSKIGGVVAAQFLKDYKHLVQEKLNYVEYGFPDIETFIKAIPDYARFEYSQKEMAFKIFGVGDPNTYMSMAAKKAQGTGMYTESRNKCYKGNGMPETDDAKKLVPNGHGLYTLCFKIEHIDSTDRDYLMRKFSDVGEIGEVNVTARWVFIRYKTKNGALAALQKYSSDYDMHIAEEKASSGNRRSRVPKNNDVGVCVSNTAECFNCQKPGHKAADCPQPRKISEKPEPVPKSKKKLKRAKGRNPPSSKGDADKISRKSNGNKNQYLCVFVGNISASKTEAEFAELLKPYNHRGFRIVVKEQKVYAFVKVPTTADAQALIDGLQGVTFGNRELQVRLSDNQRHVQPLQDKGCSLSITTSATPPWTPLPSGHSISATTTDLYAQSDTSSNSSLPCSQQSSELDLSFSNLNIRVGADGDKVITSSPITVGRTVSKGLAVSGMPQFAECVPELEEIPELEDIEDEDYDDDGDDDDDDCDELESGPVSIFVGNFPSGTTDRELISLFWVYGVVDVNMINNRFYGHNCTKAFVWLKNAKTAKAAIADLNQRNYMGSVLLVDVPRGSRDRVQSKWSDSDLLSDKNSIASTISETEELEAFTLEMKLESFSHFIDKMKAWKNTLEPGMIIQVCVSTVEKKNIFWGQNISEKEEMKKLEDLTTELQKPSSRLSRTKGLGRCAAKFDNVWYRAWVIRVFNDQNRVHVFYIDYGNTSIVNASDSYIIPSMFWSLGPRCRPFKIIGSCPDNLNELESEVISCKVISSASSTESFMTEITIIDK